MARRWLGKSVLYSDELETVQLTSMFKHHPSVFHSCEESVIVRTVFITKALRLELTRR